jgi:drug/metabolite transporter (DMT)-like permease
MPKLLFSNYVIDITFAHLQAELNNKRTLAHVALLGANLIYGIGFSVAKILMPSKILPHAYILIRVSCACVLLLLMRLLIDGVKTKIALSDYPRLIACAATGIAINMLLFFSGLNLTTPIHGSLMMLATPILVSILASILLKDKFTSNKISGLLLGVVGASILILGRTSSDKGTNIVLGDLYIFINACSYAFYLVLVKPLMHKYRPIVVISQVFIIGLLMVLPFGWQQLQLIQWQTFSHSDFAALSFIIIGVTFFTYLWNIYAIKHLSSSTAGAYIYSQPVFAALVSVLYFGEHLSIAKLGAAILIFCGVWLATRPATS